ncbi:MAG TPA: triose-phosphate isomerase [Anaerolineaceae bacterium]|jgi:triosephosphate isomerase|nr:triose-phosphate isomerase [Anaerolineaceae bacterium]
MTARKPMVAANWKMNKTAFEARELIQAMLPELKKIEAVDIVLCPPFTNLSLVCEQIAETDLKLGAQNMHWQEKGAFTGEISASMLTDFCDYVILGHSERRQMFGETNETVNKKAHTALAHDLKPIICVGESLEQNQAGETAQVVETQCRESLQDITPEQAQNIVIAYEPVWAIGTGLAATPEGANEVHRDVIRPVLRDLFGTEIAEGMRILYGGSVNAENAGELFAMSDIDGGLIGGASLKADAFVAVVKAAAETL